MNDSNFTIDLSNTANYLDIPPIFVVADLNADGVRSRCLALKALIGDILGRSTVEINSIDELGVIKENQPVIIFIGDANSLPLSQYRKNKIIVFPYLFESFIKRFTFSEIGKPLTLVIEEIQCIGKSPPLFIAQDNIINFQIDVLGKYFDQVRAFGLGMSNVNEICAIQRIFRSLFIQLRINIAERHLPTSIFTIDSEDQHNYFDNLNKVCTDISGSKENLEDMRLSNAIETTINRFQPFGIKPVFMATGSDLTIESVDGYGNPIDSPLKNLQTLKKFTEENACAVGLHGYDHSDWLGYGYAQCKPMSSVAKFLYFINTGGNPIIFFKYFSKLISDRKTAKKDKILGSMGEFSESYLDSQIGGLIRLFRSSNVRYINLHRAPGYRRTNLMVGYLEGLGIHDSSDQLEMTFPLSPPVPYSLFKIKNRTISLSLCKEYPCIFVDKYIRTTKLNKLEYFINELKKLSQYNEAVITLISHTKVTGGDFKHFHIYPKKPTSGFAAPPRLHNLNKILDFLKKHTQNAIEVRCE